MKTLLILVAILLSIEAATQNITATDGKITYQKVFDAPGLSKVDIVNLFHSGPFTQIDTMSLYSKLNNYTINYKKHGYSMMNIPVYARGNFTGNVKIELKDNRYRVTASNFMYTAGVEFNIGGVTATDQPTPLETYALKKDGTIRPAQQIVIDAIDKDLTDLFTIKQQTNDNW